MVNNLEEALKRISLFDVIKTITTSKESKISETSPKPEEGKYMTGKQVDKLLQISSPTRHRYANDGLLTRHKISPKKIMYEQKEVLKLLQAKDAQG